MQNNSAKPLYWRLLSLLRPHIKKLGIAFLCMIGSGICAAVPAWLFWTAILAAKILWATGMTCLVRRIPLFRSVYETR